MSIPFTISFSAQNWFEKIKNENSLYFNLMICYEFITPSQKKKIHSEKNTSFEARKRVQSIKYLF